MKPLKSQFSILEKYPNLVYLDNGATTLKPKAVLDKLVEYYSEYGANIHRGVYRISQRATDEYEQAREKVAGFIGAKNSSEIVFTSGATAAINLVASSWGENNLRVGDEIVVSLMEHHSNLVPWQQLAKKKKAALNYLAINNNQLSIEEIERVVNKKTKLLALTQVSNVLGTVNPIKEIVQKAREINPEIVIVVDGAQAVGHLPVSMRELGCDFYAFSGHKMYGPTGIGVLWGRPEILEKMDPISFGGGMIREVDQTESTWAGVPEKFEAGTPPIGAAIGLGAAIDFILGIGWKDIIEQEKLTLEYALEMLTKFPGVKIIGDVQVENRIGIIPLIVGGVHAHDVGTILDRFEVAVRSGHHCAMPLHQALGVEATTRVSLGMYNTREDIDKLMEGLREVGKIFKYLKISP
jgi:cysteine desulfurase/selenocysteine lyase